MDKKTKQPLDELVAFTTESEKTLFRWFIIIDVFFLISSFIVEFVSEKILKLSILSFSRYGILVVGNIILFSFTTFSLLKNYKIWLLKYLFAIYLILLLSAWMYFTDPKYSRSIFVTIPATAIALSIMFYDVKVSFLFVFLGAIFYGLLLFHYLRVGFSLDFYEVALNYIILFLCSGMVGVFTPRIKIFLAELLEKRREAEEARAVLEIKVRARTRELEELAANLEEQVKQRTKELQERINELERFHRLTVGRELTMVELKKEIERLKQELEKYKKQQN